MYINWENEQGNLREVTAVYDRILGIPTQLYSHHFQRYGERSFLWNIFGYLWWSIHNIEHDSLFWNDISDLIRWNQFFRDIFPCIYEMFNNLLVLYGKLLLSILYPRYFRAVKKWENKFNKWLFVILNLYGAWQILSAYFLYYLIFWDALLLCFPCWSRVFNLLTPHSKIWNYRHTLLCWVLFFFFF